MAKTHKKRCSTSTIRELKIRSTLGYHFTPVRMAIIKKSTNNKCCRECALSNFDQWLPKHLKGAHWAKKRHLQM